MKIKNIYYLFLLYICMISAIEAKERWVESLCPFGICPECSLICATKSVGFPPKPLSATGNKKEFSKAVWPIRLYYLNCECELRKGVFEVLGDVIADGAKRVINDFKELPSEVVNTVKDVMDFITDIPVDIHELISLIDNRGSEIKKYVDYLLDNKEKFDKSLNSIQNEIAKIISNELSIVFKKQQELKQVIDNKKEEIGSTSGSNTVKAEAVVDIMSKGALIIKDMSKIIDDLDFTNALIALKDAVSNIKNIFLNVASIRRIVSNLKHIKNMVKFYSNTFAIMPGDNNSKKYLDSVLKADDLLIKLVDESGLKGGEMLLPLNNIEEDINIILKGSKAFASFKDIINKFIEQVIRGKVDPGDFIKRLQDKVQIIKDIIEVDTSKKEGLNFRKERLLELIKYFVSTINDFKIKIENTSEIFKKVINIFEWKNNMNDLMRIFGEMYQNGLEVMGNIVDIIYYFEKILGIVESLINEVEGELDVDIFTDSVDIGLRSLKQHLSDEIKLLSKVIKEVYDVDYKAPIF